jgi:superfamily II DNA helicase RecQ
MPPGGLLKLRPFRIHFEDSRFNISLVTATNTRIQSEDVLHGTHVIDETFICDKFNLEALTVNQVKSFKALADGKDVFIETKTGSGIFAYISSITCAPEN